MLIFIVLCCVSSLAQAKIQASIKEVYYQFKANDISEMTKEVRNKGPKSNEGLNTWAMLYTDITAEYKLRTTERGCRFDTVEVDVFAKMVLPLWEDIKAQGEKTQHRWMAYKDYLKEHELMHFSVAKKHAKKLLVKMKTSHESKNCQELRVVYLNYKQKMLTEIQREDREVDRKSKIKFHNNSELMLPLKKFIKSSVSFVSNESLGF